MSAEARALLDQLMGAERDVEESQKTGKEVTFSDDHVCKYFICGIHLYDLFRNTKSDLGPYTKQAVEVCKEQWQALSQEEKDGYGYEWDLFRKLEGLVQECERKVVRGRARVAEEDRANALDGTEDDKDLERTVMMAKIEELNTEAEAAGDEGDVEKAMGLMDQAKALKTQVDGLEEEKKKAEGRTASGGVVKKLILCEVTGNFLSSTDSDERVR